MGGKSTTTQVQNKDPWAPAQADLKTALGGAADAYNNTYNGTGVASMDPLVMQAQDQVVANANTGAASNLATGALGNFSDVMANGGLSQLQSGAASGIGSALTDYSGQMKQLQGYLDPYASGQYLQQKNPYFDQALSDSMQKAADMTNRQFSGSGRYGSGANAGALGLNLGRIATDANMQEYARQQQNQLGAISTMGGLANGAFGNIMGGQQAMGNIGQQGISNTGAIGSMIPQLATAQNVDAANLAAVGGQRMDYSQSLIDAANQNPWTKVGNLAQIAGGIGGLGGTSVSQGTQKTDPGAAGIIGGVMAGAGGLANLSKGVGAAGGFSGMASTLLPFLSDERLKENKKHVATTRDGLKIYLYNFKGDERQQIGLMAQEVLQHKPEAVVRSPSGYLMVDYAKALEDA